MNREQAEKLLTALVFDDLDEASKTNLLSYLEGDEELRERVTDMRMAAKVASDTLRHGPEPVLGKERLKRLASLAERRGAGARIFTMRRLAAAAAAVVAAVVLPAAILLPSLNKARSYSVRVDSSPAAGLRHGAEVKAPGLYGWDVEKTMDDAEASGGRDFYGRRYAYDPVGRDNYSFEPPVAGVEILADGDGFVMGEAGKVGGEAFLIPGGQASGRAPGAEVLSQHYYSGDISGAPSPSTAATGQPGVVDNHFRADYGFAMVGKTDEDLIASEAYKFRKDAAAGVDVAGGADFGKTISSPDLVGAMVTDGRNVTFIDGHFGPSTEMQEVPATVTGSGLYSGASVPADRLDSLLQIEGGAKKVAAKETDDDVYARFDGAKRRGTLGKDYGDLDAFGVGHGAEGEELDRKKAQSLDSGYGTIRIADSLTSIKERALRDEVSKEKASGIDKAAEKQDAASMKYGESLVPPPAAEFKLPGIRRSAGEVRLREIQGGDVGNKSESTEPVKLGTSSREPMLGDMPVSGVLFDHKAGESELGKGETRRKDEDLDGREFPAERKAKGDETQKNEEGRAAGPIPGIKDIPLVGVLFSGRDSEERAVGMSGRGEQAGGTAGSSGQTVAGPGGVDQQGLELAVKKLAPLNAEPEEPMIVAQTVAAGALAPVAPAPESELGGPADKPSSAEGVGMVGGEDVGDLPEAARFKVVPVNPWVMTERDSMSTFGLDVDTASYTLCRRYIRGGFLPPTGAVRMEEFINYFNYRYPQRANPVFAVHAEAGRSPFAGEGKDLTLLKIGVKARTIGRDQRRASHLIFVVDASASMDQPDRLGLVQQALKMLVRRLAAVDRVTLITCAGDARLHLEAVSAREREKIVAAIEAIQPGGPTNLLAGLKLGYAAARRAFAPKQINHVVLCSDGVANVGQTEAEAVLNEVAADRKQGITITCVGVGYGSYNDVFLEALANQGDGSYVFLDSPGQAVRVFVEQLAATLQTVARDARIQVAFNPNRVRRYRLIGYENRDIEDSRFRDDTVDAGEVGSGQCSTALYELELSGQDSADQQEDFGTVFVRYRNAESGQIEEISSRLDSAVVRRRTVEGAPGFFLAACAGRFAEILRQSEHAQDGKLADVLQVAEQVSQALPLDRDVRELAELIRRAENLPAAP